MSAPIKVLAAMDGAIEVLRIGGCGTHVKELTEARDAVADLIKAIHESRIATQAFADDGQHNWRRYRASDARIVAALKKVGAA